MMKFVRSGLPIVLLLFTLSACSRPAATAVAPAAKEGERSSRQETEREADEILRSVIASLRPDASADTFPIAVKQLNQYLQRRQGEVKELPAALKDQIAALLGPAAALDAERAEFGPADAEYLRSALFLQKVAQHVPRSGGGDLVVAQSLFDWTMDQAQFVPIGWQAEGPPLEVLLRGSGNVHERSWIFLELLRQAGLLGCMVGFPDTKGETILPWFCGVLQRDQVYLFDPVYGLPVPGKSGSPATLEVLLQDPDSITPLNVDPKIRDCRPPAGFARPSLLLPLEAPMLAPRMQFLQKNLTGAGRANLHVDFDAWFDRATLALARLPGNMGVRVWQYPEQTWEQARLDRRPILSTINVYWLLNPKSPRLEQLLGKYDEALRNFVQLDMNPLRPAQFQQAIGADGKMPVELRRRVQAQTRQDLLYFGALCQLDRPGANFPVAGQWFQRYLDRFGSCAFRSDDLLSWQPLCERVTSGAKSANPSPGRRIVTLYPAAAELFEAAGVVFGALSRLSAPTEKDAGPNLKEAAQQAGPQYPTILAAFSKLSQDVATLREPLKGSIATLESMAEPAANDQDATSRLGPAANAISSGILALLNDCLNRRDLYEPASFADIAGRPALEGGLQFLLAIPESQRSAGQLQRLNRILLDEAFPNALALGTPVYTLGAIRGKARALKEAGKKSEAIALLLKTDPLLLPIDQAALKAQAKAWEASK